jgi:hypothetical protein
MARSNSRLKAGERTEQLQRDTLVIDEAHLLFNGSLPPQRARRFRRSQSTTAAKRSGNGLVVCWPCRPPRMKAKLSERHLAMRLARIRQR